MSTPLRPGDRTRLGRYELIGRLGEGGMGAVYLARDPDGRQVAIKMVRPEFAGDAEFRGRFRSEVNRAQQVPPFSTAEVLDADPDHEPPYLVVEYVDGPSLAAEIRDRGPLSGATLHSVAVGTATALTAIHSAGVIHRDLKPGNVLFARGGIKVIDFGIARAFEATSQHTRTDQMVGTVAYMAPERFDAEGGRPVTAAADIFAWGAVVAYAATGRTPFAADNAAATAMRILTQPPDLTGVPASLMPTVERALAKDPLARPTARELLDLLLAGAADPTRPAPRAPVPPQMPPPPPTPHSGPASTAEPASFTGRVPASAQAAALTSAAPVPADPPTSQRRRWPLLVATTAAVLIAAGLGAAARYLPILPNDQQAGGPVSPGPATGSAPPPTGPAVVEPVTPRERLDAILRGDRRTLIHVAEVDRDLALDLSDYEVAAGDGTGAKSEFSLIRVGVDHMIRTLRDPAGPETCLGVKIVPGELARLVPTTCDPTAATLFSLNSTDGGVDDQGRPTYHISNDDHGFVQFDADRRVLYVQQVGDADPMSTFSFVDRGWLPSPSPS